MAHVRHALGSLVEGAGARLARLNCEVRNPTRPLRSTLAAGCRACSPLCPLFQLAVLWATWVARLGAAAPRLLELDQRARPPVSRRHLQVALSKSLAAVACLVAKAPTFPVPDDAILFRVLGASDGFLQCPVAGRAAARRLPKDLAVPEALREHLVAGAPQVPLTNFAVLAVTRCATTDLSFQQHVIAGVTTMMSFTVDISHACVSTKAAADAATGPLMPGSEQTIVALGPSAGPRLLQRTHAVFATRGGWCLHLAGPH
mmetsp:Transcript_3639/g.6929  ORF Transcript_3639/g.6929 Transcript_3639/m.6929 type:complete len:259 (-) Transcript_3639:126-902(-)